MTVVADRLRELGVRLSGDEETVTIEVAGYHERRPLRVVPAGVPVTSAVERDMAGAVVLAERLPPRAAERLRRNGVWFADVAGNAYVAAPGVLIDVRGRTRIAERPARSGHAVPRNLFSAQRARVIFVLLTWPETLRSPLRELAELAGVSPAMAYQTIRLLETQNYLIPKASRLNRRDELIDLWVGAFPMGLAPAIELGRFVGRPDPSAWARDGAVAYVSGEAASDELVGPDLTLYVPSLDPRLIVQSRWRRPEPEEPANIVLRSTFWREPLDHPQREVDAALRLAPPILRCADLLASGDPRHRQVALALRGSL